jgi:hypothetical protein
MNSAANLRVMSLSPFLFRPAGSVRPAHPGVIGAAEKAGGFFILTAVLDFWFT